MNGTGTGGGVEVEADVRAQARQVFRRSEVAETPLTSADTAVTVPVDVAAGPYSCSRPAIGLASGQPGLEPALVPPVSYRGQPFEVDNTTGGTSTLVAWWRLVALGVLAAAGVERKQRRVIVRSVVHPHGAANLVEDVIATVVDEYALGRVEELLLVPVHR